MPQALAESTLYRIDGPAATETAGVGLLAGNGQANTQTEDRRRRLRAGVSTATVSRTLASPDQVKPKTRDAVMRAVRETGYVLNLAARNLRTSRTHAVLAVLPDASNIFFSQVLRGISDTLHQHGYSLVIADTANDPEREREHAEFIQGGRVDGVLLLNGRLLPSPAAKRGHQVPTVSLCERIPGSRLPHVETANRDAARAMTEYLLKLGHRRIGYLAGPPANVLEHDRFAGYQRRACRRRNSA